MDRISALRNIEEALSAFEAGEQTLPELERDVRGVLRTYATDFEDASAYRVRSEGRADGLVVLASSAAGAREKVAELYDDGSGDVSVERVD